MEIGSLKLLTTVCLTHMAFNTRQNLLDTLEVMELFLEWYSPDSMKP